MLFRVVLVTMAAFTVLPVNAEEIDAENKQSFELASNPDVIYQPWPGPGAAETHDIVPPPPPGPYMSSALSGLNKGFSGESVSNTDIKAGSAQPSPLIRSNTPWPVKGDQPKVWTPEKGVAYAPENNQPAAINQMQASRMYRPPNFNFAPPQMNQQQMQQRMQEQMKQRQEQQKKMQEQMQARQKQQQAMQGQARQPQARQPQARQPQARPPQMPQRMQEQQKKMQEMMRQRQKQQQAMQGQARQPQARSPQMPQRMQEQQKKMQEMMRQRQKQHQAIQEQMRQQHVRPTQMQQRNRHQPVWENFDMPMSNYPGPQQRTRQPIPR